MSKMLTTEGLSVLRDEFKYYEELDDFMAKYQNVTFDFSSVKLIDDPDYPSIDQSVISQFYANYENNPKDEFSLAKIIYEALPLEPFQASNNLYWLYLNLEPFFSYIKSRWLEKWNENEEKLKSDTEKFFLSLEPSQNSLIKSPIAGLWWSIHLTIDDSLDDKYYYSKVFLSERHLRDKNIGTHQLIRVKKVLHAVLDFYIKYKDTELEGKRIGSEAIAQQMMKLLNQIGGLTVLSYLNKNEVFQKMEEYKDTVFLRAREVQLGKRESRERLDKLRNRKKEEEEEEELDNDEKDQIDGDDIPQKNDEINHRNHSEYKILRYFNLNESGQYKLTEKISPGFKYNLPICEKDRNGHLLICYNEFGNVNQVTISSLLNKSGNLYWNGMYNRYTINQLFIIPSQSILGIIYYYNDVKYFKAHLTDQFKEDNDNLSLQGYKTMYNAYDNIEYIILPYNIRYAIGDLIFKTFMSSGIEFNHSDYREAFRVINAHIN